jgi:hypothetical protein
MTREEQLNSQGWVRRFVADEPRLSEAVESYRQLGYEVHLEPLPADPQEGECRSCLDLDPERYRIIYTRRSAAGETSLEDDLYD